MRSLLQKKTDKAASTVPNWHPDFRQVDRLPDIKVIRTAFFENAHAVSLAIGMIVWFTVQAYSIQTLVAQVQDWDTRIKANKKGSDTALVLNGKFEEEAKKLAEVDAFVAKRFSAFDLFIHLGETRPRGVTLQTVEIRDNGVALRGFIAGTAEKTTGAASAYLESIRTDSKFSMLFEEFTPSVLNRETDKNRLRFEFFLKYKTGTKS